jgi:hypothetical protein
LSKEPKFAKNNNTSNAFVIPRASLEAYLKKKEIWKVVFCGVSVDLCLGSTVRDASDRGVGTHIVVINNGQPEKDLKVKGEGDLVLFGDGCGYSGMAPFIIHFSGRF